VQMGTAFLPCPESGLAACYRAALARATETDTELTRAFSGRPARGIVNRFLAEMRAADGAGDIAAFPMQNALTRPLRTAAAAQGRAEFLSLWAGQAAALAMAEPAATVVARIAGQARATLQRAANQ
jgi:nitronate monooxygenase